MHVYLDNNSTTQPAPQVVEAVTRVLTEEWGNPSSVHRFGQAARRAVELARQQVCALLGCTERELIFTSGATESNNTALRGLLGVRPGRRTIVTTKLEHSAVREPCARLEKDGFNVIYLPVNIDGLVDLDALGQTFTAHADDI